MERVTLEMTPGPGSRMMRFVGDRVRFSLKEMGNRPAREGWRALLRTNLGRADVLRREIVAAHAHGLALGGAVWRDLPMLRDAEGWSLELPLAETGYFKAKAYLADQQGWQHWPEGSDAGISVHPDRYRTGNTIYCAFTRLFGATKSATSARDEKREQLLASLDKEGYAVIPPSGKLRDLTKQLPHIFGALGCRILHLLPVSPTPTTYARFGRFGSPYAALDLTAIDPALVEFDRRTTGVEQFQELAYETHRCGGRLVIDIVINHTGWGSVLQETHPEWFLKGADANFVSPGAWGTIWEDLVELKHENLDLWDSLADMFLTWCRRGVDGFRCDAGYMVPAPAWQYIVARVQQEFPDALFLLEGLGGAWDTTETLLTEGGMQWAYSELFQNYSAREVSGYLEHSLAQSRRAGLLVHYSETHDNARLAARGRAWSLLRNRLCALASVNGGYGFTCGVEWLTAEKVNVHGCAGLSWGAQENLVPELKALNQLLADHPCFFDGATVQRLSAPDSPVLVLRRDSEEGKDSVLILVNTDVERSQPLTLSAAACESFIRRAQVANEKSDRAQSGAAAVASSERSKTAPAVPASTKKPFEEAPAGSLDLLGQALPDFERKGDSVLLTLPAGASFCLAAQSKPKGLSGEGYRRARAQAAWGMQTLLALLPARAVPLYSWREAAALVEADPARWLAMVSFLSARLAEAADHQTFLNQFGSLETLTNPKSAGAGLLWTPVIQWRLVDRNRVLLVPPQHWLLIEDTAPFRATLETQAGVQHVESLAAGQNHIACFPPQSSSSDATLSLERYAEKDRRVETPIRFLSAEPESDVSGSQRTRNTQHATRSLLPLPSDLVLLTNGRGGMARICVDLGQVRSKYDCVLGANLHPTLPVDRHVLCKRIRLWLDADGFISPLDFNNLVRFEPGPPALWDFVANAGDGRTVEVQMRAEMVEGENTTLFRFSRPSESEASGKQLPQEADARLTVRLDIEDRGFHSQTKRNGGADYHFNNNTRVLGGPRIGFEFTPASDRQLRVFCDRGAYYPQPEWSENIPHPIEQSRGQEGAGDAFSPGWFEVPLPKGAQVILTVTAEPVAQVFQPAVSQVSKPAMLGVSERSTPTHAAGSECSTDSFEEKLRQAARAFVVQRGQGKTVIAGYPWFLDWGRDSFICARGLIAAGWLQEVKDLLVTFARFEKDGTLPNTIFGEDASNRDTSDASLWFGVVCEEMAEQYLASGGADAGRAFYDTQTDSQGRTLRNVLSSIATHYQRGTPNRIRMDPESALIWSPSHFTWMDTNYPACTPREGFPIEIQALWIRLLRQLARINPGASESTQAEKLAAQALDSVQRLFWQEDRGWYGDVLLARPGEPASKATLDDALRSNCLFLVSLGLAEGERAQRCVQAAQRHLVIPGALRSLAPLPVSVPLANRGNQGQLLNDPSAPYWGRYEGDEDTRRKPAYHNGTGWVWTFPTFCEALARAWDSSPQAVAAARSYLGSVDRLLGEGSLGQLPEIVDGDAPHAQRGCDAQAWSATEVLRVWKVLDRLMKI
jgi:starch synthase (maltosyl-transferring)